ncbi:MAG: hypothetical protein M0R05_06775 [Bacilli bacterium]|nr:hypothetical protein [Bacilli bacterium]
MESNTIGEQEKTVNDIRKDATRKTVLINRATLKKMNWRKIRKEYKLIKRGMLDDAGLIVIEGENSVTPVWDLSKYAFLLSDSMPDTVNPILWNQGKLNLKAGLFRVTDNIYQVRGFDAGNMTLIRGDAG